MSDGERMFRGFDGLARLPASTALGLSVEIRVTATVALPNEGVFRAPIGFSSFACATNELAPAPELVALIERMIPVLELAGVNVRLTGFSFDVKDRDPHEWIRRIARQEFERSMTKAVTAA